MAGVIPRVIHQTWKGPTLPARYRAFADTWRKAHPGWQWRLWTDADNVRFVAQEFPELLPRYLGYPQQIQRVDMIRYLLLYRLGGLYVDLDFECFRSIAPLLQGQDCVLSLEADANNTVHRTRRIVSNAFMAAVPGHPLFAAVIEDLQTHRSSQTIPDRIVLDTTGPMMLTRVLDRLGTDAAVSVLGAEHLFPLSLAEADQMGTAGPGAPIGADIRAKLEPAFGMHWHDGTWWRPRPGTMPGRRGPLRTLRRWLASARGTR